MQQRSFFSFWLLTALSTVFFLLIYQHSQMYFLIVQLHELNSRYQDRINRCEEFISQQLTVQGNQFPLALTIEPELLLPLNRNIDYLQSAAFDYFKQNDMERLWEGMVHSFTSCEAARGDKQSAHANNKKQPVCPR